MVRISIIAVCLALGLAAQAPDTPAPATPPTPPSMWTVGGVDISGLVDGYYTFNDNHPTSGVNGLYNFDVRADQPSLNMAKLSFVRAPAPIGFEVDFGAGKAFDIMHSTDPAPRFTHYLENAFISVKPASAKGLEIDFGEFVTSAGAEVIESMSNWNYSRSILFAYAIPYYHAGIRATAPFGKYFTAGVQVVNGWNNIQDNNTGKTVGLSGNFTGKKLTWSNNYYVGPEKNHTNRGWRNLYDTTLLFTPTDKFNAYLNFDYGRDKNIGPGAQLWVGFAGAAHYQIDKHYAVASRLEWYDDKNGFTTGTAQHVKEFTLTGERKLGRYFLSRLEYRHDWSNEPFYDRGSALASAKTQDTVTLGVMAFFGPKT